MIVTNIRDRHLPYSRWEYAPGEWWCWQEGYGTTKPVYHCRTIGCSGPHQRMVLVGDGPSWEERKALFDAYTASKDQPSSNASSDE